jgi:hypothetical protein
MKCVYNFAVETSWNGVGRIVLKSFVGKIGCDDVRRIVVTQVYDTHTVQWQGLILVMLETSDTITTDKWLCKLMIT